MKRHLSDSEPDLIDCDEYDECSSPDTAQVISRKKRRGIIEKRRRDRINNCLLELRRLVPAAFEKQGSAKLEKAEILQMTVDHLRHLHQCRDARGFSDPFGPYGNTRAFLDYRIMGFRECVGETARYLTSVEGVDMKDPLRVRVLNHLESYLAQRELAINAAVVASSQMAGGGLQKGPAAVAAGMGVGQGSPLPPNAAIKLSPGPGSIPVTPPRSSPESFSPPAAPADALPRFSVAYPAPIISFAPTANIPVFRAAAPPNPSGFAATAARPGPLAMGGSARGVLLSPPAEKLVGSLGAKKPEQPYLLSPVSPDLSPKKPLIFNVVGSTSLVTGAGSPTGSIGSPIHSPTSTGSGYSSPVQQTSTHVKAPFRPWTSSTSDSNTSNNVTSTAAIVV